MATTDPRAYLWRNICNLLGDKNPSLDKVQQATGIGRGSVQRIKAGDAATRISTLTTLAEHLGVEVWQLLVPDIQKDKLPELADLEGERWPFTFESRRFAALLPREQGMVEYAARFAD